jgi:hypothetical protein
MYPVQEEYQMFTMHSLYQECVFTWVNAMLQRREHFAVNYLRSHFSLMARATFVY